MQLLTRLVFDSGHVLWKEFALELPVIFVLGQPASVRKEPFLAEWWAVDLDVLQVPRASAAGVVVADSALAAIIQLGKRPHRRLITLRKCEWIRPILISSNTRFLGPTRVNNPKRHLDRFSRSTSCCISPWPKQWEKGKFRPYILETTWLILMKLETLELPPKTTPTQHFSSNSSSSSKKPTIYPPIHPFNTGHNALPQPKKQPKSIRTHLIFLSSPMSTASITNSSVWFFSNLFLLVLDDFKLMTPARTTIARGSRRI